MRHKALWRRVWGSRRLAGGLIRPLATFRPPHAGAARPRPVKRSTVRHSYPLSGDPSLCPSFSFNSLFWKSLHSRWAFQDREGLPGV